MTSSTAGDKPIEHKDIQSISTTKLFGIEIHRLNLSEATDLVLQWLEKQTRPCRMIVTPNVNHVALLDKNRSFREAYGEASLILADGRYIGLFSRWLGRGSLPMVNGSDLVPEIFKHCARRDSTEIFLLGAGPGVASEAARKIERKYQAVHVTGTYSPPLGFENTPVECARITEMINSLKPDVLVVGISPPRQEIWLAQNIATLDVSVAICAGATIDFLAMQKRRAPRWIQRARLEWFYRLLTDPTRLLPRYVGDALSLIPILWREWRSGKISQ